MPTKVAVCQVPDIREDVQAVLEWIEKFTQEAQEKGVALLCFPECFLQGYLTEELLARHHALAIPSQAFNQLLTQLATYRPMIVIGLIEEENGFLFNTAVVIQEGVLVGKYRKTHLLAGEKIFNTGSAYPVFQINDLTFGINICYDTQFSVAARAIVQQGARLILCPANNMMRYETAEKFKNLHHNMRIERVMENKVWLLSADITGEREGRISYGPTSAINPWGRIVDQVPLLETGMIVVSI